MTAVAAAALTAPAMSSAAADSTDSTQPTTTAEADRSSDAWVADRLSEYRAAGLSDTQAQAKLEQTQAAHADQMGKLLDEMKREGRSIEEIEEATGTVYGGDAGEIEPQSSGEWLSFHDFDRWVSAEGWDVVSISWNHDRDLESGEDAIAIGFEEGVKVLGGHVTACDAGGADECRNNGLRWNIQNGRGAVDPFYSEEGDYGTARLNVTQWKDGPGRCQAIAGYSHTWQGDPRLTGFGVGPYSINFSWENVGEEWNRSKVSRFGKSCG